MWRGNNNERGRKAVCGCVRPVSLLFRLTFTSRRSSSYRLFCRVNSACRAENFCVFFFGEGGGGTALPSFACPRVALPTPFQCAWLLHLFLLGRKQKERGLRPRFKDRRRCREAGKRAQSLLPRKARHQPGCTPVSPCTGPDGGNFYDLGRRVRIFNFATV